MLNKDRHYQGPDYLESAMKGFYTRFPYPPPPMTFPLLDGSEFETIALNQSIGDFDHRTVSSNANIWIAGCGTNQAVYTALRFPNATVLGSDISPASLEIAARTATSLGISNLTLREESLNTVTYCDEFDYIISTGVIHHNEDPRKSLSNIARALRRGGVLELMVYNSFHRTVSAAIQESVRAIMRHNSQLSSYEESLALAKAIAATEPIASSPYITNLQTAGDNELADALIHPVEHSYTVASLSALCGECGLQLTLPCRDQFSNEHGLKWTIQFSTKELQELVDGLPDVIRWQVANLTLLGRSPMLWFFVRHQQDPCNAYYERSVNREFLDRRFVRAKATLRNYVRGSNQQYKLSSVGVPYPRRPDDGLASRVMDRTNGTATISEILSALGVDKPCDSVITDLRVQTTTSQCPYLRSV